MKERNVNQSPVAQRPRATKVLAFLGPSEIGGEVVRSQEMLEDIEIEARLGTVLEAISEAASLGRADIAILQVDPESEAELEAFRDVAVKYASDLHVIATSAGLTAQSTRRLIQVGAIDVLPQPITQQALVIALERASGLAHQRHGAGHREKGFVVSVLKGGGGVGATAIAAQTALALSSGSSGTSTALIDFDIQFGALGLYLDLPGKRSIIDVIESEDRVDAALIKSVMYKHTSGLSILTAPKRVTPLEKITPSAASSVISLTRDQFDYVLVDLPAVWTSWTFRVLQESDLILVVTEPSVGCIRQAERQLAMLRDQNLANVPVEVVLNRYKKGLFRAIDVSACEAGLGRKIDHVIPNNYRLISAALNRGVPLAEIQDGSAIEKAVIKLTESIVREVAQPKE